MLVTVCCAAYLIHVIATCCRIPKRVHAPACKLGNVADRNNYYSGHFIHKDLCDIDFSSCRDTWCLATGASAHCGISLRA